MFQRVMIAGRLGAGPEMRYTAKGSPVTNFSVAVQEGDKVIWFRVAAWGKLAETCNQYLTRGKAMLVEGKMQKNTWEDKEGRSRETWQLRADRVVFLPREGARERVEERADEEEIPF